MAYIYWWNRTGPNYQWANALDSMKFLLARNTLSPTKSYTVEDRTRHESPAEIS